MARRRYRSDHRAWFRVPEDILDDPLLNQCPPAARWLYIQLFALFNRAHNRTGHITLPARVLNGLTGLDRSKTDKLLNSLQDADKLRHFREGKATYIELHNYLKIQGFAPAELQRTPSIAGGQRRSDDGREGYEAARLVTLLGPGDQAEKLVWLDERIPHIVAAARTRLAEKGNDAPTRRALTAAVKERMLAFWNWQKNHPHSAESPVEGRDRRSRSAVRKVQRELGI